LTHKAEDNDSAVSMYAVKEFSYRQFSIVIFVVY
jgi:hypothetical protein